jgi:beta-lactam-binding protein with PASTA domain
VIHQSVTAGTEVEEGSTIGFQISQGSGSSVDPTTSSSPQPSSTVVYTKKIQVTLPTDPSSVRVRVEVDSVVKYDNVVDSSMGTIYPAVTGSGIQQVSIYIDNVLQESYPVDFSKPSD